MPPNPSDIHITHHKLHNYNETELTARDIEDIMLVPHIISRREVLPHICKVLPLSILNDFVPPLQRHSRRLIPRSLKELLQLPM